MNDNDHCAPIPGGKNAVARIGAFAKRRNPLPSDPPENDVVVDDAANSTPLHVGPQKSIDLAESPIDQHQRLEWAATLRSYRNTKLLLSSLVEVIPRGTLTLVS
jgi:hypothetical protein